MRELVLKMSMSLDGLSRAPMAMPNGYSALTRRPRPGPWRLCGTLVRISWAVASFHDMAAFCARLDHDIRAGDEPDPQGGVFQTGMPVPRRRPRRPGTPGALDRAGDTQTGQLQPGGESWAEAHVASGDLAQEINKLKAATDGKPILAHGGARFARSLIAQNLVDVYALMIHPIALGKGLAIFSDLPAERRLKLVSSRAFPGGAVAQIYRPA